MTEELEKKLNELLGMKKQLEDLTANREKSEASSIFEEKKRKTRVYFYVWLAISVGIMLAGAGIVLISSGKPQIIGLFYAIIGFGSTILMKMWFHTIATKLAILQEMKQFELRITDMLKH